MNVHKLIVGTFACLTANAALAGAVVPLGTPLGRSLGIALGAVLGFPLGSDLPISSSSLLVIATVSLVVGICVVRRKKKH